MPRLTFAAGSLRYGGRLGPRDTELGEPTRLFLLPLGCAYECDSLVPSTAPTHHRLAHLTLSSKAIWRRLVLSGDRAEISFQGFCGEYATHAAADLHVSNRNHLGIFPAAACSRLSDVPGPCRNPQATRSAMSARPLLRPSLQQGPSLLLPCSFPLPISLHNQQSCVR